MGRTDTEYVETASLVGVSTLRRKLTRYDFVLGVIPLALLSGTVAGTVMPVSQQLLLGVGAICCLPVLFDALFRNPPVPARHESTEVEAAQRSAGDRVPAQDVDGRTRS